MMTKPTILSQEQLEKLPPHRLKEYHRVFKKYYFTLKFKLQEQMDSDQDVVLMTWLDKEIKTLYPIWKTIKEVSEKRNPKK
jgi:hypothetical protein